jgi:hypothetical protein
MSDMSPEVLVVGTVAGLDGEQLRRLRRAAVVTAVMPPRLALVRPREGEPLPQLAGVHYLSDGADLRDDAGADLTSEERLFVDAWRARFTPKARRGDGLAWDSPGFTPPL